MARNAIQFQDGLSLGAFIASYATEEQCVAALTRWRWPDGFGCGGKAHAIVGRRRLYQCRGCRRQTSLKAGTIFDHSLIPLSKWFQAMWLLTQSKGSIATLVLARKLDLKWDSAWLLRQKLAQGKLEREDSSPLVTPAAPWSAPRVPMPGSRAPSRQKSVSAMRLRSLAWHRARCLPRELISVYC